MPKTQLQQQSQLTSTHKIIEKQQLATKTMLLGIHAPEIAAKAKAGQFVMVMADAKSERIPLTIVDWNTRTGEISIIFQEMGHSTQKIGDLGVATNCSQLLVP
jgi:NAD(P)H-flavin reductase